MPNGRPSREASRHRQAGETPTPPPSQARERKEGCPLPAGGAGSAPGTPLAKRLRAPAHPEPSAFQTQTATDVGTPQPPGTPARKPASGPRGGGPAGFRPRDGGAAPVNSLRLRTSGFEGAQSPPNLFTAVCLFCLFKKKVLRIAEASFQILRCSRPGGAWPARCPEATWTFPDTVSHSFRPAPAQKPALRGRTVPHTVVL